MVVIGVAVEKAVAPGKAVVVGAVVAAGAVGKSVTVAEARVGVAVIGRGVAVDEGAGELSAQAATITSRVVRKLSSRSFFKATTFRTR